MNMVYVDFIQYVWDRTVRMKAKTKLRVENELIFKYDQYGWYHKCWIACYGKIKGNLTHGLKIKCTNIKEKRRNIWYED